MLERPDWQKPRLVNLWVTDINQINPLLSFLSGTIRNSALVRDVERHLRESNVGARTGQGIQDLIQFAEYVGLVKRAGDRYDLTVDGMSYVNRSGLRAVPGKAGAEVLRRIWARRPGANRLFQSMQGLLGVLIQIGAARAPVGPPGRYVNATLDVLTWYLNYLHAYDVIERFSGGNVKLTAAGLELAGDLGLIEVKQPEASTPEQMVPVSAVEPEPMSPESEPQVAAPEPAALMPKPATPTSEPVAPAPHIALAQPSADPQGAPTEVGMDRSALADAILSILSEKLKPIIQVSLELKAQVRRIEGEMGELTSDLQAALELYEGPMKANEQQTQKALASLQELHRLIPEALSRVSAEQRTLLDQRVGELSDAFTTRLLALDEQVKVLEQRPAGESNAQLLEKLVDHLAGSKPTREEVPPPPAAPLTLITSQAPCQSVSSERALVEEMARRLNDAGYRLDLKEVANLYTCIKSGRLTILAGPPGSGKSSMVRQFADVMGHRSTLAEIPVRRGWTDDQQFMGAINRLHQRYEPAPTGVVPHLLAAQQDPERGLYWFLLDEFNLSTPEYYFAEFISVLESAQPRVSLYTPGVSLVNADQYPATLPVGENVHFFATVNLDDTASPLSPRLIDRANLLWVERQVTPEMLRMAELAPGRIGPISAAELRRQYVRRPEFVGLTRTWWDQAQQILSAKKEEFGAPHLVSPRSMMGLAGYLANAPQGALESKDAFDFGLAQRVLPGLRGFGSGYGRRLQRLYEFAGGLKLAQTTMLLERILQNGSSRGHEYDFFSCLW